MTSRCPWHCEFDERLNRCELKALTTERDVTAAAAEIRQVAESFLVCQTALVSEMKNLMEHFAELLRASSGWGHK